MKIRGTNAADVILTSSAAVIRGHAQGDAIYGSAGKDIIRGGRGDDGNRSLIDETDHFGIFLDPITALPLGGLWGGFGDDKIFGGRGDDDIYGDAGRDILWGGKGNDTFHFDLVSSAPGSKDVIRDFESGHDKIALKFAEPPGIEIGRSVVRIDGDHDGKIDVAIKVKGDAVTQGDLLLT